MSNWRGLPLLGALGLAAGLKVALLYAGVFPFNSDEAVVGLMARHILLLGERPLFFYGQAYLGSLDAWLTAGAFALFGQSVLVLRGVQAALYLGTILTTYGLALKLYSNRWIANAAALGLAVPTVLVSLYTTVTLGGYGETLLMGNLLLLLVLSRTRGLLHSAPPSLFSAFLPGLLSGLGFWTFPLIGVYLLPIVAYLLWARRWRWPHWILFIMGLGVGMAPWGWHTLTRGAATLSELGGSAIAGASAPNPLVAVFTHLINFLILGWTVTFGLRPPWGTQILALPLAWLAVVVYAGLIGFVVRWIVGAVRAKRESSPLSRSALSRSGFGRRASRRGGEGRALLLGVCLTLIAAFILTPFGADPSGRYFLPLAVPLALFLAEGLNALRAQSRWLANGLMLGVVTFNLWGTVQSAVRVPPGFTTQFDAVAQVDQRAMPELIAFLREHGETRGYTNYWVSFPLAFLSDEELIYEARLPYHLDFRYTLRDSRYLPYTQAVQRGARVAYITTRHPPLDKRLRENLEALGVTFSEKQIGDFHVFYALSRVVTPEELGLGLECCAP